MPGTTTATLVHRSVDMRQWSLFRTHALLLCGSLCLLATVTCAQDSSLVRTKGLFYPAPMVGQKWRSSIGFVAISTPPELTEEVQIRAPAGDWHVQRRLSDRVLLDGRLLFQVLQNQFSLGPRWNSQLSDRVCIGLGDDLAFWAGRLGFAGFDSRATGWMNMPSVSIGYRFDKELLLSFKAEALYTLNYTSKNGDLGTTDTKNRLSGCAFTLALEQPLYHRKHLTLAATALYSDLYWVTWALYDTFQRPILYPQLTVGFIL